jgi:glycine/sarcosine/betaine reductase complex component A
MDLRSQEAIVKLAEQNGKENLLVILGSPDPESAEIAAETVIVGDPSYAGPLTEAQLGLDVHHVLDEEVRKHIPEDVWEDQIGVMADVFDAEGINDAVARMREGAEGS